MKKLFFVSIASVLLMLTSCSENYSNGERIGVITQFSETGLIWKSWEGHLNVTQTGMNSSVPFDFSIDNDNPDQKVIKMLDSAAQHGWKVKLVYHETAGKNWFSNRGETNHFITKVEVLEKNFGNTFHSNQQPKVTGKVIDTIYVVIDKSK
ncbi:MAG: hypothetical protein K9G36_03985 [Crocinitomicaceae bacterium]|jgi:hypothetical protein|nr:hypothetical protein [Crocinitomicaceae bacterium]MCF8410678.1 hypothetical protein [Crocinitomicaceae bacterium]MCF8443494.1 hypothetical protein [Crocinitomicaceae bacterium]